jgi:lysozyme
MFIDVLESIKRHEGFRPTVYEDSLGFLTLGYGFKTSEFDLTPQEAEMILHRKLIELADAVHKRFWWFDKMPEAAQDIVLEMCYQLGVDGFAKFTNTIERLCLDDFKGAAKHMRDSLWYRQTTNRAEEMTKRMEAI